MKYMGKRAKSVAAVAIAMSALLASGAFTGCQFVTTDTNKDFSQVVAEIDITKSKDFAQGGQYAEYGKVIGKTEVLKRDLAASFLSNYSNLQNQGYGDYASMFKTICENLVARQIRIQYAMAYLLENGDAEGNGYTVEGYQAAAADKQDPLAGVKYFLTEVEREQGLYVTRVRFNNTLDSNEKRTLGDSSSNSSSSGAARTLPTGVDASNSEYYDGSYRVYIGFNSASNCGTYKTLEGSSVTSRKNAFNSFLSSLRENDLLNKGENPIIKDESGRMLFNEDISYFQMELRSQYESILLTKLTKLFEKKAEEQITQAEISSDFENEYKNQSEDYKADPSSFESALDSFKDDAYLFTAPEEGYGYVINILLPFSASQSAALKDAPQDQGDPKGNKFMQRANLLKNVVATDQRESWITGDTDHSFDASAQGSTVKDYYTGGKAERKQLFFEDGLIVDYTNDYFNVANDTRLKNYTDEYTPIGKYYGRYTFNGSVEYSKQDKTYRIVKNDVSIDQFIGEMEGYLNSSFKTVFGRDSVATGSVVYQDYYTRGYSSYYKTNEDQSVDYNTVDYGKFVYYQGKVNFADAFDANKMFVAGSEENLAFSVINELSFAYNTDTAGLNPYLGYSVVTGKTNYMTEFEYAAQEVCKEGAGSYIVAPTDYGWHIIYCTFSFLENADGEIKPFAFDYTQRYTKGTTSNLYFEAMKSKYVSDFSSIMSKAVDVAYNNEDCVTIYEKRYENFSNMGA